MRNIKYITLLFLSFISSFVHAQVILNQEQCRQMAIESSKQILIADQERVQANHLYKSIQARFFPALYGKGMGLYNQKKYNYSLKGGYLPSYIPDANGKLQPNYLIDPNTQKPMIGANGMPVFQEYAFLPDIQIELGARGVYDVGVELQQPLFMGGKIRFSAKAAKVGEEIAYQKVKYNTSEVLYNTDKAYYQFIQAKELILVAQRYREVIDQLYQEVSNAYRVGLAMSNALYQVEVKKNEAILMHQKATHGAKLASMNLCRLIGLDLNTELNINDTLVAQIKTDIWTLDSTPDHRPEYNMLEENIKLKQQEVRIARSEFLPQFGISGGYYYSGGLTMNGEGDSNGTFRAIASISIPIFKWGEGRNKIKQAQSAKEISSLQLEESNEFMQLEIAAARFSILDAQTRINMVRKAITDANENLKIATQEYRVGLQTLTNLLEAQLMWQKIHNQWIEAKAELQLAQTTYLKAIGALEH